MRRTIARLLIFSKRLSKKMIFSKSGGAPAARPGAPLRVTGARATGWWAKRTRGFHLPAPETRPTAFAFTGFDAMLADNRRSEALERPRPPTPAKEETDDRSLSLSDHCRGPRPLPAGCGPSAGPGNWRVDNLHPRGWRPCLARSPSKLSPWSVHVCARRRFRDQFGARARRPLLGRRGIWQPRGRLPVRRRGRSARSRRRPSGAAISRRLSVRPRGEHQGRARGSLAQVGFRRVQSRRRRRRHNRIESHSRRRQKPSPGDERALAGQSQRAMLAVEGSYELARGRQDHRDSAPSFGLSTSPNAAAFIPRNGFGPNSGIA